MILGPLARQQFRRALAVSQGDLMTIFSQPISAGVFAITAVVLGDPPQGPGLRAASQWWREQR